MRPYNFTKLMLYQKLLVYWRWVLVVVGVVVFFDALGGGFVMDDYSVVAYNPLVRSVKNIPRMFLGSMFFDVAKTESGGGQFYRPVVSVVYALIYMFAGAKPVAYHVIQIGLHIVNAILVFELFKKFLNNKWAAVLSLVFLVHPINVQAVSYIGSLNDV